MRLLDRLIDKQSLARLLEQYHIPHPVTLIIDPGSDLTVASKEISYPCILKPRYPTRFRLDFPTKGFLASDPKQFIEQVGKAAEKGHAMIAQEIIPGTAAAMHGFNAYYDKNGGVHGAFVYERVREWPLDFGNGCCLRQAQEPSLEQMTTSLLHPLQYHGIVDVEFRRDPRDGHMKLIEINPRLWMQNSFPARLGCSHAHLAYLDALGKPLPASTPHDDASLRWVFGAEDLLSGLSGLRHGTLSIKDWFSAYRPDNVYATFSRDDPLPWVVASYRSFAWSCSQVVRHHDHQARGFTHDVKK